MAAICSKYGILWDIRFNPAKSQAITFGGSQPTGFQLLMNTEPIGWVDRVKYLGCYFSGRSCNNDPARAIGKFYGTFNNIMSVVGSGKNEILAIHLIKTYCLPSLLYGCETWTIRPLELRSINVAWNNVFRRIFNACWRESVRPLQFYNQCLPATYLIDQRRLLFWKNMMCSNNCLLHVLAKLSHADVSAISSKYAMGDSFVSMSKTEVKRRIWASFYAEMTN
jgi:hypothetical protein